MNAISVIDNLLEGIESAPVEDPVHDALAAELNSKTLDLVVDHSSESSGTGAGQCLKDRNGRSESEVLFDAERFVVDLAAVAWF